MIIANRWYTLLAGQIATALNSIGTYKVYPILSPFDPGSGFTGAGVTLGSGTLDGITKGGVFRAGIDPISGEYLIFTPPAGGGFTWLYDGVAPAPSVTVYGYALVKTSGGNQGFYATTPKLATPIVLAGPALVVLDEMVGRLRLDILA